MGEATNDELRTELAAVIDETKRHLRWMQDAGIRRLAREAPAVGQIAVPAFLARPRPPAPNPPATAAQPVARPWAPPPASPPPPPAPPVAPRVVEMPRAAPLPPTRPAKAGAEANAPDHAAALKIIREELGNCRRCKLAPGRTNIVYGQGNPNAEILFLGEAPGQDEDLSGLAFVGKAGQLLTKMIEAMGLTRDDVYICNINKCRPPNNNKPEPDEVEACRPFAERQILAIKPKVIVALGATAAHSLLRIDTPISRLRNNWTSFEGIPVMPTFHPSYLLRSPQEKGKAWDDLKLVLAKVGREVPKKSG